MPRLNNQTDKVKNWNKKYYQNHKEKWKKYYDKEKKAESNKRYYQKHKEKLRKYHKNYMKEYRKKERIKPKIKARNKARKIKIPKNKMCEICNKRKATERHHEDYNKPLKVKFVCSSCNKRLK